MKHKCGPKCDPKTGKHWTEAADDAWDKAHGIKEDSPKDKKIDAMRGLSKSAFGVDHVDKAFGDIGGIKDAVSGIKTGMSGMSSLKSGIGGVKTAGSVLGGHAVNAGIKAGGALKPLSAGIAAHPRVAVGAGVAGAGVGGFGLGRKNIAPKPPKTNPMGVGMAIGRSMGRF